MAELFWVGLGGPGEVLWATAGPDATAIVVGTSGGQLWVRRRAGDGWRWERVGIPPETDEVRDAALLAVDAAGSPALVAVSGDVRVWLYRLDGADGVWTPLGRPAPEPELPNFADGGRIAASASGQGDQTRHTLVATAASRRPWMRHGLDADGTWFPITSEDVFVSHVTTALASVAGGAAPQPHVFAFVEDIAFVGRAVRVAVRDDAVWTWLDVGAPPPDRPDAGLSATSIRDAAGQVQARAVYATGSGETRVAMLAGYGRDWQVVDLGRPPVDHSIGAAVVAGAGPDAQPGTEPVVVARAGHNIWTRTPSGEWRDLGTTPGDVAVVNPQVAFELGAAPQRRVWAAGVSWASELWTFEADDAGVRWEEHGFPGSVTAVVGAYTGGQPDHSDRPVSVFGVDERGDLWACELWSDVSIGLSLGSWVHHGRPASAITTAKGAGVAAVPGGGPDYTWTFVTGSDGRLWARTETEAGWHWADHGAPPGTAIDTAAAPIVVDPTAGPIVPALADDGRLWMRERRGGEWRWSDRGAPPGQLIFALVGASAVTTVGAAVAVVIAGEGHLWVGRPDGGWTDLGAPTPTEKIAAGIGVEAVSGGAIEVAAVGSPSGQVWTLRWTPGGGPQWTARGRPLDARIRAGIGTMPDPGNGDGSLVAVVGDDEQVWIAPTAGAAQAWSRWDPVRPGMTVRGGKAAILVESLPCALVLDARKRLHLATPDVWEGQE